MGDLGFQVGHGRNAQDVEKPMPAKRDRRFSTRENVVLVPRIGAAQLAGRWYSPMWVGTCPDQQMHRPLLILHDGLHPDRAPLSGRDQARQAGIPHTTLHYWRQRQQRTDAPAALVALFDSPEGLYSGPIDGWFAIYHRSILPLLATVPSTSYFGLGATVRARLAQRGLLGVLDRGMKVFHVIGPTYARAFGMLQFEIAKYQRLGRQDIVAWYQRDPEKLPSVEYIQERVHRIISSFDR